MLRFSLFLPFFLVCVLPLAAQAHSGHHDQEPLGEHTDWATRHMVEEHHISNFDPESFFLLHDYDASLTWTAAEISRTYGLDDESAKDVPEQKRQEVVKDVLGKFDFDVDGVVTLEEWLEGWHRGTRLQDFGLGPGHHGDDEYEYEIHHFEKFHDEYTREEDLTHPEDIAHFKKHDEEAEAAERQEAFDRMPIVEHNIPQKFRRNP